MPDRLHPCAAARGGRRGIGAGWRRLAVRVLAVSGPPRAAATSIDVARLANVSQSAVSRAFTPGASVSDDTRRKVMEAARKLGYRPNVHARSLITKRSRIIGLVLAYLENLFYPVALQQMAQRLQQDGYHVLLFVTDAHNADETVHEILQYHVDGIVLAATTLSSGLAQRCADAAIPVVLFNRVMATGSAGAVSSVRSDNVAGGRAVAQLLLDSGHQRIAYLAGQEESSTNLERERGLREGLAARGQRIWARAVGNYDFELARQATRELFGPGTGPATAAKAAERPDAIVVASDHMAFAVMDTLRHELGLRVPQDVSVTGFDNVPQAGWPSYSLTTVEQPVAEMVEASVRLLQRHLGDERPPQGDNLVLPGRLIVRGSVRGPVHG